MNRSATDRLKQLVATAVASEELTQEELAREARLPGKVFRSLLRNGHRPTIDRADELCKALGITMTRGNAEPIPGTNWHTPSTRGHGHECKPLKRKGLQNSG